MQPGGSAPQLRVVGHHGAAGWEAVYRTHVVPVFRYVFARCGNRPDAEDVTATVFLRAFPRISPAASEGEARAYLRATARSVLAEHWAARYGVELAGEVEDLAPARASGDDDGAASRRRVADLLDRLPDHYRRVLELRFLRGMSVRETARAMDVSVANAKVLQWRALRRAADLGEEVP